MMDKVPAPEWLYQTLDAHHIAYQRCDHPAVFTVAEAAQHVPPLPGAKAKNLFLRDAHSQRLFLVVVPYEKRVDLAQLAAVLGLRKLRFASEEELLDCLGVTPGAVSVLALLNDKDNRAELLMDQVIAQATALQAHPLVNTATISIPQEGLKRFLEITGHLLRPLKVPSKDDRS